MYILWSFYGLHKMKEYMRFCKESKLTPFNDSVTKMFFASFVCGYFTFNAVLLGIADGFVTFFEKTED